MTEESDAGDDQVTTSDDDDISSPDRISSLTAFVTGRHALFMRVAIFLIDRIFSIRTTEGITAEENRSQCGESAFRHHRTIYIGINEHDPPDHPTAQSPHHQATQSPDH